MARVAVIGSQGFALVNFRAALMAAMIEAGHQVVAFAPDFSQQQRDALAALGVEAVDYPLSRNALSPLRDVATLLALRRKLAETGCDTLFAFTIKPVVYGLLAGAMAGVRRRYALITGLGYTLADVGRASVKDRVIGAVARLLYRVALSVADGVFFQNADDRQVFVTAGLVDEDRVFGIVPTGVDLAEWTLAPPVTEPIIFTLVGRMLADKGVLEFVAAARAIKQTHPLARFVLAGGLDTNPKALTREQLQAFVDEGVVEWLGHVAILPWLQQVSVFVLPSYHEGLPRSTQEAMAVGRPIISTDVSGCRDTVVEGRNGFLVPPRDAAALAGAMRRFIDKTELIVEMGQQSRILAEERFDVHKANHHLLQAMGL